MAHPQLPEIRARYGFRCGYCGVTEIDTGGELTVDHFRPLSAGGDNSEINLVYACVRCNQYKGALHSEATELTRTALAASSAKSHCCSHTRRRNHVPIGGADADRKFSYRSAALEPSRTHRKPPTPSIGNFAASAIGAGARRKYVFGRAACPARTLHYLP